MDLQNIFTWTLNRSLTGSIVIGCVLLARLVLKKAPRIYTWALWLVVLLRLLCPVSIPGPVSVLEFVDVSRTPSGMVEFVLRVSVSMLVGFLALENGIFLAEVGAWFGAAVILCIAYYGDMRRRFPVMK